MSSRPRRRNRCLELLTILLSAVVAFAGFGQDDQTDSQSKIFAPPIDHADLFDLFFWSAPVDEVDLPEACEERLRAYQHEYAELVSEIDEQHQQFQEAIIDRNAQGGGDKSDLFAPFVTNLARTYRALEQLDQRVLESVADTLREADVSIDVSLQSIIDRRTRALFSRILVTDNPELSIDFWDLARECEPLRELCVRNRAFIEGYSRDYAVASRSRWETEMKFAARAAEAARKEDALEALGEELSDEQAALEKAMAEVNRQYYWQAMTQLEGAGAYAFHRLYLSIAEPNAFEKEDEIEALCAKALQHSDLSPGQREELGSRLDTYRFTIIELEQEHLRLREELRSEIVAFAEDGREGIKKLRRERMRIRGRMQSIMEDIAVERAALKNAWEEILTPAQQAEIESPRDDG